MAMDWITGGKGRNSASPAETSTRLGPFQTNLSTRHSNTSVRPGKFANIFDFAKPENPESLQSIASQSLHHQTIASLRISVPHIVHVEDSDLNSRIHGRIMLVIRTNPPWSVTCLSFCKHEDVIDDEHCLDHAKLATETDSRSEVTSTPSHYTLDSESGYFKLHISMEHGGIKLNPVEDAYINMKELWNVELAEDVKFAIVGKVVPEHWLAARQKIIEVFSSTVGDIDRRTSWNSGVSAVADLATESSERKGKWKEKGKEKDATTHQEARAGDLDIKRSRNRGASAHADLGTDDEERRERGKGKAKARQTTTQQDSKSKIRARDKPKHWFGS